MRCCLGIMNVNKQICVVGGQYDGKSEVENKTMLLGSSFRSRM